MCGPSYDGVADLITEYAEYDEFAREYHSGTLADYDVSLDEARRRGLLDEQRTQKLWQLLGLLDSEELLIQLPEWLAEKKVESTNRTPPTMFVGYISNQTEEAVLFESSAAARPLMERAHRIHSLERGIRHTEDGTDRHGRLVERLREYERKFEDRDELLSLSDEWLPKSQLGTVVRRRS
ncbi:hypothetical protein [Halobellus sp. H-GB7]|uniref:hypothetical protein n=1 Tax=Halobellus sp. H-GB7 TaxID=3069756 RepID=UPI0027B59815|nr:hypothetical protein [Halobellus sp. H-GB7]MDQ2056328.1 hypothetical protein [Halobellus sp. H-GB7]